MSTPLSSLDSRDCNPATFLNKSLSEAPMSTNATTLECLGQLHRIDHQIVAFQSKMEISDIVKSKQAEIDHYKVQEQKKRNQANEARSNRNKIENELEHLHRRILEIERAQQEIKNTDKLLKNSKELHHVKALAQGLEFKLRPSQKENEVLLAQLAEIQEIQLGLVEQLRSIASIDDTKYRKIEIELGELETQRLHTQGQLAVRYLSLYQKIRAQRGGIAIARVLKSSCTGCHILFRPQVVIELTRSKGIEQCPSCKRILLTSSKEE